MITLDQPTHRAFSTAVAFVVLTFIFVGLRLFLRARAKQLSFLSDGLCFASLVLFCAFVGLMLEYILNNGKSDPFKPSTPTDLAKFLKILYVEQVLFTFDISLVKLSLLALYWNVFGVHRKTKIVIGTVTVGCVIWCIAFTFLAAFRCRPIGYAWVPVPPPGTCMSRSDVYLPLEATNLFFDIVVLCIPVFTIGQLKLSKTKKIPVIGIFVVGVSVCVASIGRLIGITRGDGAQMFFWSSMQLGLAIVCSCLPLLGTIIPRKNKATSYSTSEYNSFRGRGGNGSIMKLTETDSRTDCPWMQSSNTQRPERTQRARVDEGTDSDYALESLPSKNTERKEVTVV
ncbi:unnamed protein product [Clonostachys byssicola]|uniref:Rhodopsin domain-containing protein n=1 Tax=Clonostachys byssicola TaxID=160290 RepID=A0A9N9UJF9_9HYPO|nr:unnamed protein product [Clonostachys byssicola]